MTTLESLLIIICVLLGIIVIFCLPKFFVWLTVVYDDLFGEDNRKAKKRDIDNLKSSIDNLNYCMKSFRVYCEYHLNNKDNNNINN